MRLFDQHDGHSSFLGFSEFEMYSTKSGTKLINGGPHLGRVYAYIYYSSSTIVRKWILI